MKFFVDTANLSHIQEAQQMGVLDGVTTNPSLMAKEGIVGSDSITAHYKKICSIVSGDVSAEVLSADYDQMIEEGTLLSKLSPQIVVKVPCTKDGIKAVRYFTDHGIRTNCTLVFTVGQALLAAKAGATYVSPFVGRLDDISSDGVELVARIAQMNRYYEFPTQIIAASIRSVQHIVACMEAGSDVVTAPLSSILGLLNHPLTDAGMAQFEQAAKQMLK